MKPIEFQCEQKTNKSSTTLCHEITNVSLWSDFDGYWMLPGIESANYDKKTNGLIGSRIRVLNSDGSRHIEEIIDWQEGIKISLKMHHFSAPLNKLSTHFIEQWYFKGNKSNCTVVRKFSLYPKNQLTRPLLWLISLLLRKAIQKHLIAISIA